MATNIKDPTLYNRPASDITGEQEDDLYRKIYPNMLGDFYHREDVDKWVDELHAEIASLNRALKDFQASINAAVDAAIISAILAHTHPGPGTPGAGKGAPTAAIYKGSPGRPKVGETIGRSKLTEGTSTNNGVPKKEKKGTKKAKPPFVVEIE